MGPRWYDPHLVIAKLWKHEDDFKRDILDSVLVWILIPAMGRAWSRKSGGTVASGVGKVIKIDDKSLDDAT